MSSAELNAVFNIGDSVVYPLQGVGCILSREKRNSREYYRVQITSSDMDVLLPVDKAAEIGLRHLASVTEAKKAISSLSTKRDSGKTDWKQKMYSVSDAMRSAWDSFVSEYNGAYNGSVMEEEYNAAVQSGNMVKVGKLPD